MRLVLVTAVLFVAGSTLAVLEVDPELGPIYDCSQNNSFGESRSTGNGQIRDEGGSSSSFACEGLEGAAVALRDTDSGEYVEVSGGIRTSDSASDQHDWTRDASAARCAAAGGTDSCTGSLTRARSEEHSRDESVGLWIEDNRDRQAFLVYDCTSEYGSTYQYQESWDHGTGARQSSWSKTTTRNDACDLGVMTPMASVVLVDCDKFTTLGEQDGADGYRRHEVSSETCRVGPQTDLTLSMGQDVIALSTHSGVDLVTDSECEGFVTCQSVQRAVAPAADTTVLAGGEGVTIDERIEIIRL